MKKILFITFVTAAVLCCFVYSCTKQNDYDSYIETTGERFSTVDGQVEYLESLLATLNAEKTILGDYADSLREAGDTRAEVVDSLLDDLGKKMQAVDDSLAKYATKKWADATFATLDAVKILSGTTSALAVKVKADSAAIAKNIDESIKKSEEELKAMFDSYYEIGEVDTKINELKTRLDTFPAKVAAVKDSVALLRQPVSDLQTKYADFSEKLDSAVSALKKQDTVFLNQIDSLDGVYSGRLDTLLFDIAANKAALDSLDGRIAKLEARVQSVEVVPDYIDGGVKMTKYSTAIKFEVRPASAAKALVAKGVSAFSLQAMQVKAVTKASIYTTITVQSASIDAEDSLLVLTVDGTKLPDEFFAHNQPYSARLSINDGNTGKSTPYFPLIEPIYPEAPDLVCITIKGTTWAPVNCGYSDTTKYGLLYQWGRAKGCGYNNTWTESGESKGPETEIQTYESTNPTTDNPDDNKFYKGDNTNNDWYSGAPKLSSWPMKPAHTGYKADKIANPCPSGWRVPTYNDLNTLYGGNIFVSSVEVGGQKGAYFNGTDSPGNTGVFLPAAGFRYSDMNLFSDRGIYGCYWSSSVNGNNASYLDFISDGIAGMYFQYRAYGYSVRCVME